MSKLSWFKHYNASHEGQSMAELWAQKDYETIAFYWALLELISRFEDPEKRGFWQGHLSIFKIKLGLNSQKSSKLLLRICSTFQVKVLIKSDKTFEVFVDKWLELQETRGGKREAKNEQSLGEERREKREERIKIPPNPQKGAEVLVKKNNFDFENVYKKYPRKLGKSAGFKKLKSTIKSETDFELLKISVDKFCELMKKEQRASDKIPYFSTFANSWRDYLEVEQQDFSKPQISYDHLR